MKAATPTLPDLETLLRQQESLRKVIEAISSELELRPLLTNIVRYACELIKADRGSIGLVDEARQVVRTEAVFKMPEGELGAEMPPGVGVAGHVLKTKELTVLDRYGDIAKPTQLSILEDAVLAMPILWRERMIGFIGIGAGPPRRFSEHDVATLQLLARHAGIAIANARLFGETQRALGEMRLLYDTSQRISMAMDTGGVVDAYLEQVAMRGRYACSVVLYGFDEAGRRVSVDVLGRWTPQGGLEHPAERHSHVRDALDPPLDAGETVTIRDVYSDPRVTDTLREIQRRSGRPALAMIPLMVRGDRTGLVILSHPQAHDWSAADLWPYQVTAAQLATAIDSRRQQEHLWEHGRRLAVLEERQRLARELHDSVSQLIFGMTLIAQSLEPAYRRSPSDGEGRVKRLLELSQAARAEMRALLVELRPADLLSAPLPVMMQMQRDGLVVALRNHLASVADGFELEFSAECYVRQPPGCEEALFRIAQEALNNVVKHARARRVRIDLHSDDVTANLTVQDDGRGFDLKVPVGEGHFGLQTMRERAEALGGSLKLSSSPGEGATVTVTVPRGAPQLERLGNVFK